MYHYPLVFGLKLCERILKITDNLSKTLQKQSLSAVEVQGIAELTVETLVSMRTDEAFDLFFELVEHIRKVIDTNEPSLPRKRKAPQHLEVGEGEGYHSPTAKDHYHRVYFEALDLAISSIQGRFGYAIYKNLEALLVKAANKHDYSSELTEIVHFYGDDIIKEELSTQLLILAANFQDREDCDITLQDVLSFLQKMSEGQHAFFSQVCTNARLLCVLPATNAASEQSFSTMRRLKTYLRNTIG